MRLKAKQVVQMLLLAVIMFVVVIVTIEVLKPNNGHVENFLKETAKIDVCFYGSSHVYSNVGANVLWDEYGIAAYSLAGPEQPMSVTYHTMANSFKINKPQVAVVELFMVRAPLESTYDANRRKNQYVSAIGTFPLSKEKYLAASELLGEEQKWNGFFFFPMYHGNYEKLTKDSVMEEDFDLRGFKTVFADMTAKEDVVIEEVYNTYLVAAQGELAEETKETLGRIRDLCKENEVELLFLVSPYVVSWGDAAGYAAIWKWAQEQGVDFLDMNNHVEEIGLDWKADMCDLGHANYWGACKNSRWLGEYLTGNYALQDRRQEPGYDNWDKNTLILKHLLVKEEMNRAEDLGAVIKVLSNHKEKLWISIISGNNIGQEQELTLQKYGFDIKDRQAIFYKQGVLKKEITELQGISAVNSTLYYDKGENGEVVCRFFEETLVTDCLGIAVYDEYLGEIIYKKTFNNE